jgi:hypothetical protein
MIGLYDDSGALEHVGPFTSLSHSRDISATD